MMKNSNRTHPTSINLNPVVDSQDNRVIISMPIQDGLVYAQAWYLQIDTVRLYLLDTDIPQNKEVDRHITDQLYSPSKEIRFKQEIILGIGGLRLLRALNINPIGYHLNEGHSALLALEIARYEMEKHHHDFKTELDNTKQHIFFTNHTLVPAGNDNFNADLAATLLNGIAKELQAPVNDIVSLGLIADSNIFSMTLLALRMAGKINAVSVIHGQKAKGIWREFNLTPITNGINIKNWDQIEDKENIWNKHQNNKQKLLDYIKLESGVAWDKNTLLLGWARRIVGYKRPLALFENIDQFKKLATDPHRPIRVVISGLAHEHDQQGLHILEQVQKIVGQDLKDLVVYLPNYHLTTAKLLVSGCDVWLNTPVVGSEACGTSGMKAALNGVLPLSTLDGWVAEANYFNVGWTLTNDNLSANIYSILKENIIPLYYRKDTNGISSKWIEMMKNSRDMVINQFSGTKMLRKYFENFYLPQIRNHL